MSSISPDQWLARTPEWHRHEAAKLEAAIAGGQVQRSDLAFARIQAHLAWAQVKVSQMGMNP